MSTTNILNLEEAQPQLSSAKASQEDCLSAVLALARLAAHEINQPLAVLQNEIQLMELLGTNPDATTLQLMQEAVNEISERLKTYQQLTSCYTVEVLPGINVLDLGSAKARTLAS
jgi:signal transduction histidine kinase